MDIGECVRIASLAWHRCRNELLLWMLTEADERRINIQADNDQAASGHNEALPGKMKKAAFLELESIRMRIQVPFYPCSRCPMRWRTEGRYFGYGMKIA